MLNGWANRGTCPVLLDRVLPIDYGQVPTIWPLPLGTYPGPEEFDAISNMSNEVVDAVDGRRWSVPMWLYTAPRKIPLSGSWNRTTGGIWYLVCKYLYRDQI
jgi:hypothetical protein